MYLFTFQTSEDEITDLAAKDEISTNTQDMICNFLAKTSIRKAE